MKIEIEIPDKVVPFFEAEAEVFRLTLAELLVRKLFQGGMRHEHIAKGGIPSAPNEQQNEDAAALGTTPCLQCKQPDVVEGLKHTCPMP